MASKGVVNEMNKWKCKAVDAERMKCGQATRVDKRVVWKARMLRLLSALVFGILVGMLFWVGYALS